MKKKQKWFKREILERFMDKVEIKHFEDDYYQAKLVNVGRRFVTKNPKQLPA